MSATGSTQHDQEATLHSLFQSRLLGTQEMEDPHLKEKLGGPLQHCWCQSQGARKLTTADHLLLSTVRLTKTHIFQPENRTTSASVTH